MPRLFILDANALLHRAWHALPPLTSPDGMIVNCVYGVLMATLKLIEREKPDAFVACWDTPEPTFRHTAFEAYKAQREKQADELYAQIPIVQEGLRLLGIPSLEQPGFEADDLIGTLACEAKHKGWSVTILTGDRDLLQLIDPSVTVQFFRKGITQVDIITQDNVHEIFGLTPAQVIDYKIMRGDTSDNIPGIKGIGEKGAKELIDRYGDLESIMKAAKDDSTEMTKRQRACLLEGEKDLLQWRSLVTIRCDAPIPWMLTTTDLVPYDEHFIAFLLKYGFKSLVPKGLGKGVDNSTPKKSLALAPATQSMMRLSTALIEPKIEDAKTLTELQDWFDAHPGFVSVVVTASSGMMFAPEIWLGSDGEALHILADIWREEGFALRSAELFQGRAKDLVFHGAKDLFHILAKHGLILHGLGFDTQIAAYLLESNIAEPTLEDLILRYLNQEGAVTSSLATVSLLALRSVLDADIKEKNLDDIVTRFEIPLIPVLFDMERDGIKIDLDFLAGLDHEFAGEVRALEKKMQESAGRGFNPASPAQLAQVLFQDLKLPTDGIKKGKTGFSTAASELEKLHGQHPIIEQIESYREVAKLLSTYVQPLPKLADASERVHTTFHQALASTGRLSSTDPNLQNIPIRTEYGRRIRSAFVAPKGRVLLSFDYAQIELRIAAELSKDKTLTQAFIDGQDIHKTTAAAMWSIPLEEVTTDQRRAAKAVNFGVLYGQGAFGLASAAGVTHAEAKEFIARYFAAYADLRIYLDSVKEFARENGYVETLFGRRRPMPEVFSPLPMIRAQGERMAINMPIQGTAADILKLAMIRIADELPTFSPSARIVLQVHDELIFEVDQNEVEMLIPKIKRSMQGVGDLKVPLLVEAKYGKSWGDME